MLNIVILAAGIGKRMQSDFPKVLHEIAGKPMLLHLLETARGLEPDRLIAVVGHGQAQIRAALAGQPDVVFAEQAPPMGTGHAVSQAVEHLLSDGEADATLVLYGDVPLVQAQTLQALLGGSDGGLALLTETMDNPEGYGALFAMMNSGWCQLWKKGCLCGVTRNTRSEYGHVGGLDTDACAVAEPN